MSFFTLGPNGIYNNGTIMGGMTYTAPVKRNNTTCKKDVRVLAAFNIYIGPALQLRGVKELILGPLAIRISKYYVETGVVSDKF